MISNRHPVTHVQVRAGDVKNHMGQTLIPAHMCEPDTILSLPAQYTKDTKTLFDSVCTHKDVKIAIQKYVDEGMVQQVGTVIAKHKQSMRERGQLPNTGGNCRVVFILMMTRRLNKHIRPVDAGYLWQQIESIDKRDIIREPFKKPESGMAQATLDFGKKALHDALVRRADLARKDPEVNVTDDKYSACIKEPSRTARTQHPSPIPAGSLHRDDASGMFNWFMERFGIEFLHPWQKELLKKLETSMNRYEGLNFPNGRIKTREAISNNIGGNNKSDMKASYEIHAQGVRRQHDDFVDMNHYMVNVDVSSLQAAVDETLKINNGEPMQNIEDRVVIRGRDAAAMSEDEILNVINDLEAQVKRYTEMPTKTKVVAKRVEGLKADIAKLVEYIDRDENDEAADSAD